jgi:hypothetical protein
VEQCVSSRTTRDFISGLAAHWTVLALSLAGLPALAQYPGQVTNADKNTQPLRSVAVLEWTGDPQHPKASRLVPVTVFDGQQLQDGGFYLARPEPLALEGEVEYQLKDNGKNTGLFVIQNAAQEQGSWVGYGTWKPLPVPKAAPAASTQSWKEDDADSDRPTLHRKSHSGDSSDKGSSGAGTGPADPDRPTLHKGGDAGSGNSGSSGDSGGSASGSGPAPDPDRPVLHKAPDDSAGGGDPDRPKLTKKNDGNDVKNDDSDVGHVTSLPDVSDPDRPRLVPGKPADMGPAVLPSLLGLPPDMQQAVAVSDVKKVPEHIWSYSWANPEDEAKFKAQLEDMARTALGLNPPPAPAKPAPRKPATHSSTHKTQLALPQPPTPLVDEHFRVFELAYGSGATLVLSARTDGSSDDPKTGQKVSQKFVTIVAQPDLYGSLAVLLKNVTDTAHLDDKPRMRLVDAVDAMADNRGELLFELRGESQRQFALYRVLRGQMLQVFVSGGKDMAIANNTGAN